MTAVAARTVSADGSAATRYSARFNAMTSWFIRAPRQLRVAGRIDLGRLALIPASRVMPTTETATVTKVSRRISKRSFHRHLNGGGRGASRDGDE